MSPSEQRPDIEDVEAFNDQLARDHDIDDYYARSSLPIRIIEQRRLRHIRDLVRCRPGERVLEVGCGGGHVLRLFPEAQLVGVDVSEVMLDKARRNLAGLEATLLHGELDDVGLDPGSFDAIVCTEVLEHVVDPEAVLRSMAGLVKPSGRVVVTFPNDNLINGIKGVVKRTGLTRLPPLQRVEWGGDHYHLHVWSVDEMRQLLSRFFTVREERFAPLRALPIRCCFLCRP